MPPGAQSSKQATQPQAPQTAPQQVASPKAPQAKVARNERQVKTLLRSDARSDLLADTKEERLQWLNAQKDDVLKELVDAALKKMTADLGAKMGKVVTAQKQQILDHAKTAVQAQVTAQASKGEASDIKPETLVAESQAWTDAASVAGDQAKDIVDKQADTLTASGAGAFKVAPEASLKKDARAKHLAQVTADAKRLIDAKAKEIEVKLTADATKAGSQSQTDLVTAAKTKAATKATGGVAGEVAARHEHDAKVEAAIEAPIKQAGDEIRTATRKYLETGLGANGTGWFRSAQFKAFHAKMKEAARAKGHDETDKAIADKRAAGGGQAGHKAEFEYQTVQAQALTHKAAKLELREIMKEFAGELLDQTDKAVKIAELLHAPATAAAWAALRHDPDKPAGKAAALKAATSAVKAAKPEVLEKFHAKAQELKNAYVKVGDQDPTQQQTHQAAKNKEVVDTKINPGFDKRTDKDGQKFGQRMLKQAMEAPTAGKGLQMLAGLIDAAAPQKGDEVELEVSIKIPATHGAFCYFGVKGTAERAEHMELGIEIGFGAGWETWGLSAKGGFKIYLKAGAHDSVSAMQLIHYGAFRNLTHASNDAANFWAGVQDPKKTASTRGKEIGKTEQAELWAAMTEERIFGGKDKKAFVEVGGGIAGGANLKAGVEAEATAALTTARRWDAGVFEGVKNDPTNTHGHDLGSMGDRANAGDRDARKALAQEKRDLVAKHVKRVNKFKFATSLQAEANGQTFTLGLEATKVFGDIKKWEIEISGGIPYDPSSGGSSTLFSKIAAAYVPAAISGVKKMYDAYKAKHPDAGEHEEEVGAGKVAGGALDTGEDLLVGLDAGGMTNNLLKKLSDANPQNMAAGHAAGTNDTARLWLGQSKGMRNLMGEGGDMSKTSSDAPEAQPFGSTSTLEVAMSIEKVGTKPAEVSFKVSKSKELKAGANLGGGLGLTAKLTRKQELAST